uniref:Ovule protein n=1 Tax=Panagrellus redivivus TaxID=6233 RepID=A0A7E4VC04_PANRE
MRPPTSTDPSNSLISAPDRNISTFAHRLFIRGFEKREKETNHFDESEFDPSSFSDNENANRVTDRFGRYKLMDFSWISSVAE